MRAHHAPALVILLAMFVGCPSSPQEEQSKFERLRTDVKGLVALYPGFKAPLEARVAEASKAFDAGKAASDEKSQINMISEASRQLMGGYVSDLRNLDGKIKDVRAKIVEVSGLGTDDPSKASVKAASDDAQKALTDVEARVKTGAKDDAEAKAVLGKVMGDLASAMSNLDKVKASITEKTKAVDAAKTKAADDAKAQDAAAQKAKEPWKCSRCDSKNPVTETKCPSCGAARDQK
jgi:hypothetical protein